MSAMSPFFTSSYSFSGCGSSWSGGKMVKPVFGHRLAQMQGGALTLIYAVAAVGITHETEQFAVAYEFVDQHLAVLIMNVVIAGAVYKEEVSFKA